LAKGHNVTYEVIIPLKHSTLATDEVDWHVSENGDTCPHFVTGRCEMAAALLLIENVHLWWHLAGA
jgi:hypothetical protein